MRGGRPREPELAAILAPVIEESREKVMGLVAEEAKEEVEEQFGRLKSGLLDTLQRAKWKTEPGQAKEWVRKLLRLEEEKRALEAKHRDYIETLTKRMMAKNDEYQREIARLQRENTLLSSNMTPPKRSTVSSPKSRPLTRAITPDLEASHTRARQRTPDKREGSPIQRSVSPAERKIQGLKTELEGYKERLNSVEYDADLLRAWKESYARNPPDYAEMVHHHHSESEYERKQLMMKTQALQHQMRAMTVSLQRFVRLGSALTKSCRDREAVNRFEDARADLELQVRDLEKEGDTKEQPDAFAEMLSLIQKEVEAAGGCDSSPAAFIAQQSQTIAALKQQLGELGEAVEKAKRDSKLMQDKQQVERMTIQRLSEELEDLRRSKPTRQDPSKALKSLATDLTQQLNLMTKLLLECINRRSVQITALSTRLSSLKRLYRENTTQTADLKKANALLTVSLSVLQKENKDFKAGIQQQRAELIAKDAEIGELVREVQSEEANNESLRLELEARSENILSGREKELESLFQETRKVMETERIRLLEEAKALKGKAKAAESEAAALKDQLESLQSKQVVEFTELQSAYKTLQEELRSSKQQLQDFKRLDQQRTAAIEALDLEKTSLKAQIERVRASSEGEGKEWTRRLELLRTEGTKGLKEAESKAEAFKLERDRLADTNNALESDLAALRRLSEDAENEKSRLISTQTRLESRISAAVERESELQQTCSQLKLDNQRQANELLEIKSQRQTLLSDLRTAEKHAEKVSIIDALQLQLTSQSEEIQRLREKEDESWREKERLENALREALRNASKAGAQSARWKRLGRYVKDIVGEYRDLLTAARAAAIEFNRSGIETSSAVVKTIERLTDSQTELQARNSAAIKRLQGENAGLESSFEAQKRQAEETNRKLQTAKAQIEGEFDAFRSDSEAKIRALDLENATLKSLRDTENAKAKENSDLLKKRLEALTKHQEENGKNSENALFAAEKQLQACQEDRENALNQLQAAKEACRKLELKCLSEAKELQAKEQELVTATEANWRVRSELETQREEAQRGIEALERQVRELRDAEKLAVASQKDTEALIATLRAQIQTLEADSKRYSIALQAKESTINTQNTDFEAKKLHFTAQLAAVQLEKDALNKQFEALKMRFDALAQGSDSEAKEIVSLREENEKLEGNIAKLEEIIANLKENNAKLEGNIAKLEENIVKLEENIANLKENHANLLISHKANMESKEGQVKSLSFELETAQKQAKAASDLQFQTTEQVVSLEDKISTLEQTLKQAELKAQSVETLTSALENAKNEIKSAQSTASQLQMALALEAQTVDSLKQHVSSLEADNLALKEDLRKLSCEPIHSEHSDQSGHLEIVKEGEVVEDFAAAELRAEVEVMAAGAEQEDSQMGELREILSEYPNSDIVHTVRQLIEELTVYKRSKTGVVIPKLLLPTLHSSQGVQTSPHYAHSLSSFQAGSEDEKSSERHADSPTQSKSVILPTLQDQDTPRSKAFPELWRSRASSELKQVKTEEIYSLHNRIRGLEKEIVEETKIREHLERQTLVLKEEIKEKDRTIRRMAVAETAGEKSPVNVEHLKDLIVKLIMMVPEL